MSPIILLPLLLIIYIYLYIYVYNMYVAASVGHLVFLEVVAGV